MFARREAEDATTVIRTSSTEYVDLWREGQLDVDFVVSSELETAHAISRILGVPAARQTDVFADGQVQLAEFDVDDDASPSVLGYRCATPRSRRLEGRRDHPRRRDDPSGRRRRDHGRRPDRRHRLAGAVKAWSELLWPEGGTVRDVVIFGAGRVGSAIARVLLAQGLSVRHDRGVEGAGAPRRRGAPEGARLQRHRLRRRTSSSASASARRRPAIFAMRDDAKNLYAASIAQVHGIPFTIAIAHEAVSVSAFDRAGIDVSINPRAVTAEEIVRFAHDPRTQQIAMLEGNRYEVLDVTTRDSSRYIGMAFRDMPVHGSIIGAIVRNGAAIFPHGDDVLQAGDRVIIFTEATNAPWVVEAL